jgi:hypothetical protein
MKLFANKKRWGYIWKIGGTLLVLIVVACSVSIDTIVQPATVTGGQVLNVTLNGTWVANQSETANLVIGILVPTVWNAGANTTMTFTSGITSGAQSLSLIPAGTQSPNGGGVTWPTDLANTLGHEGNLIPEWEWVVFQSDAPLTIGNQTVSYTVNIQITTAPNSLYFNMGYFCGNNSDGIHNAFWGSASELYAISGPQPITVNGTGTLLNFVNPQLSVVTPSTATDNDIISIPFGATVISNALSNSKNIYLCATGYTNGGDSIQVCKQTTQTQLDSAGFNNWQIDIWPRGFFNLSTSQTLDSMHYYFTDATGTTRVGNGGGSTPPFSFTFGCQ